MPWPNFFIGGAGKSGTTMLYVYLQKLKSVYMSPIKEPNFFAPSVYPYKRLMSITNTNEYLKLFDKAGDAKVIGEASHSYLTDPNSAELIYKNVPNAKFVFILRNPIERAYSNYLHNVRNNSEKLSFKESIKKELNNEIDHSVHRIYLKGSLYSESIKKYSKIFKNENILILIFEEFIKNEKSELNKVLRFLDITETIPNIGKIDNAYRVPKNIISDCVVSSKTIYKIVRKLRIPQTRIQYIRERFLEKKIPKPKMNQEDRKFLKEYFSQDVNELEKILGRSLPWPEFNDSLFVS